jgi:hypothetical protein
MTFTNQTSTGSRYVKDLVERIVSSFVLTFLGALTAGGWFDIGQITDLSIPRKAALAGIVAVLSLIKGLVAKFVADRNSASLAPGV